MYESKEPPAHAVAQAGFALIIYTEQLWHTT